MNNRLLAEILSGFPLGLALFATSGSWFGLLGSLLLSASTLALLWSSKVVGEKSVLDRRTVFKTFVLAAIIWTLGMLAAMPFYASLIPANIRLFLPFMCGLLGALYVLTGYLLLVILKRWRPEPEQS